MGILRYCFYLSLRICRKHPNGTHYDCPHCSYKSTTKETLRKHVRKVHEVTTTADPLVDDQEHQEDDPPTYIYCNDVVGGDSSAADEAAMETLFVQNAAGGGGSNTTFIICDGSTVDPSFVGLETNSGGEAGDIYLVTAVSGSGGGRLCVPVPAESVRILQLIETSDRHASQPAKVKVVDVAFNGIVFRGWILIFLRLTGR